MSIIYDTLNDGGLLSKAIPNFRSRPQQLEFAVKTAQVLVNGGVLLAECPPGVGKSFGYSVPLIAMVNKSPTVIRNKVKRIFDEDDHEYRYETVQERDNYRALIVTANIALQEQLVGKDLPLLKKVMPQKFNFILAKGRSNYICYDFVHSDAAAQTMLFDKGAALEYSGLLNWARKTTTGDMNELDFVPNKQAWAELVKGSDECKGRKCKNYHNCFVNKARQGIKDSNIIVCNYHLFFTHLAFGTSVIPDFDAVVMDEAHNAVDIARDIFGWKLTYYAVKRASAPLLLIGKSGTREQLLREARNFFDDLRSYKESGDYKARIKVKDFVKTKNLMQALTAAAIDYETEAETTQKEERMVEAKLWSARCQTIGGKIQEAMQLSQESCVYHIEIDNHDSVSLNCRAIDVSRPLHERLFADTKTVVLTSATLAVKGSMDHLVNDLGIWREDRENLIVGSPFNLVKQSIIIVPRDTPGPDNPEGIANVIEICVNAAQGRTLCLFTSFKNLYVTRDRLRERTTWNVLSQGDKPRTRLIEEFRADVRSVLLGVESFWAGIDVPGEALSCLIIDRLPFPTPEDPILDATKDRGGNWFMGYSIPRAVTTFRQGVGRLIRSVHDRGVVVVLDDRLVRARYGTMFTSSFPKRMRISKSLSDVQNFLESK
jgi:ATP-dependent DNA helicase DinG